ncbi:hypothetical protein ANANG_G00109110 [Anguilla anguilla]|uniref:Uncharacterized protein n=1 Tax=Anguilla anguilla TaxID=7936 RepID=A0A9D3MKH1_ANGAN|nr:hypothetical protein ANANG_G00109110 [Anguilla anguilla]
MYNTGDTFTASFVSATQLRQHHHHPQPNGAAAAAPTESIESQFSCPICLEVYHKPVSIVSCAHTGLSSRSTLSVCSGRCPLCRPLTESLTDAGWMLRRPLPQPRSNVGAE